MKRQYKNYLLEPKFQLKVGGYFLAFGFVLALVMFVVIRVLVSGAFATLLGPTGHPETQLVYESLASQISYLSISLFLFYTVIVGLFAIVWTHRIVGPQRVIISYIDDMIDGFYDANRKLRKNDELKPVMNKLNELAQALEEQKENTTSKS